MLLEVSKHYEEGAKNIANVIGKKEYRCTVYIDKVQ